MAARAFDRNALLAWDCSSKDDREQSHPGDAAGPRRSSRKAAFQRYSEADVAGTLRGDLPGGIDGCLNRVQVRSKRLHGLSRIGEVDLVRIRQNATDRALPLLEHVRHVGKVGRLAADSESHA